MKELTNSFDGASKLATVPGQWSQGICLAARISAICR